MSPLLAQSGQIETSDVCPLLDQKQTYRYVRFTPESGHRSARRECPLRADCVAKVAKQAL
jgi:hypothetical protein